MAATCSTCYGKTYILEPFYGASLVPCPECQPRPQRQRFDWMQPVGYSQVHPETNEVLGDTISAVR